MSQESGIAAGIKVVEIGSSLSVAIAGMTLADAGAEVVSIEPPEGSLLRQEPAFAMWGRGKRSVVADLGETGGQDRMRGLVNEADVLLIGLKPASVDRLGLRYDSFSGKAPQLVYAAVTGFGSDGPYRDVPVYDAVMQARGGRMHDFSPLHEGERPAFAAAPVAAYGAAMALLKGVFGALRERERNGGQGQRVETSLARAMTVYDLGGWLPGGPPPLRLEDVPPRALCGFLAGARSRGRDRLPRRDAADGGEQHQAGPSRTSAGPDRRTHLGAMAGAICR